MIRTTRMAARPGQLFRLALGVSLAAGLVACGDQEAPPADAPAPGADGRPATSPSVPDASAPRLGSGLWRISTSGDDGGTAMRVCMDEALQERLSVIGGQIGGGCEQETAVRTPGGWKTRAVCDLSGMGGGRTVVESDVTGDLARSYAARAVSTTTGAAVPHMNRTISTTTQGVREGDCPADMRPGDVAMEGGPRFNMTEMAEMASRLRPPTG